MKQKQQTFNSLVILVGILAVGNLPLFSLGTFFLPEMTSVRNSPTESIVMLNSYRFGAILFGGYWFYFFYTLLKNTLLDGTTIFWVCHLVYNILAIFVLIGLFANSEFAPFIVVIAWPAFSICLAIGILWLEQTYKELQSQSLSYEKHLEKLKKQEQN
jgi:hypothetical protein